MAEHRTHILTVNAEEYFHAGPLSTAVRQKHWERLESRLEGNTDALLELFAEHDVTATFFVLGRSAETSPEVVRKIVAAGHEVASRGYWPKRPADMLPDEFREDLARAKEALIAAGAPSVLGYRSLRWLSADELWALDVLAEEGYQYDASIKPTRPPFTTARRFLHVSRVRHSRSNSYIWEIPISSLRLPGTKRIPISGGNYLRQLPHWLMRLGVDAWIRRKSAPLVFYVAPWELDEELPLISSASRLAQVKQYRNIERTRETLGEYLARLDFRSVAAFLELDTTAQAAPATGLRLSDSQEVAWQDSVAEIYSRPLGERTPVSLVIPLFDEEENVGYLRRTLDGVVKELAEEYCVQVVLVDDCSRDDTFARLEERFADHPSCKLRRHEVNRGVAGAILTGIRAADHEIVVSMDCDCSYDPSELVRMLPLIADADLVTASPYHPDGSVMNVPTWRLFLSHNLSRLYNVVLGGKLYTYTSCFRVYRRSGIADVELRHDGFLGVAEMLIETRLRGGRIVEHPACLESRLLGVSKMKTARTIRGHLGLIARLVVRRLFGASRTADGRSARRDGDQFRQEPVER